MSRAGKQNAGDNIRWVGTCFCSTGWSVRIWPDAATQEKVKPEESNEVFLPYGACPGWAEEESVKRGQMQADPYRIRENTE